VTGTLIGVAFNAEKRNRDHWLIEKTDKEQNHNPSYP